MSSNCSHHRQHFSTTEAEKDCNWEKNRYINILPFDHSRVILKDWAHDYINANYIKPEGNHFFGEDCKKSYIATQGCLETTISDFWYMIWQENSRIIVSLAKEFDRGYNKWSNVARYWPDPQNSCELEGGMTLTHQQEAVGPNFISRKFLLKKDRQERTIHQFHFHTWPEFGVPEQPKSMLEFIDAVNEIDNNGPIVVHCLGGVGRTGTFITIDLITDLIRRQNLLDMPDTRGTIQMLRKQRAGMVETDEQYNFIHSVVTQFMKNSKQSKK